MITETIHKGAILISKPSTLDTSFNRSIVLLVNHNTEGTVGFIVNKRINISLSNILDDVKDNHFIFEGGPVHTKNLYYIHKRPDILTDSINIFDNLYWGGDFNNLKIALHNQSVLDNEVIFFLGYTGWAPDQLKEELRNNSWLMCDNKIDLFDPNNTRNLYSNLLKNLGGSNLLWINTPKDPLMN